MGSIKRVALAAVAVAAAIWMTAWTARAVDPGIIRVGPGENLQAALNAAKPGDTILLTAGAEFAGNFVLPVKTGDQYITVRSDASAGLPAEGTRVAPSDAPKLARLRSPNTVSVLRTAAGAHHWRLQYLEFGPNRDGYGDIVAIGDGSNDQDMAAEVPQHFILQHLYVHGDPLVGQKRCLSLNAGNVVLRDSHVSDCKGVGMDTQAVAAWNGPGPFTIENNYLEAAGENVLFGGSDPAIPNLVADGITFRRNHVARPMSWRDPILATPGAVAAVQTAGGSLAAGTYGYRVIARGPVGQGTTGRSTASAEVTVQTMVGGAVTLTWTPVTGATEYVVYGRTPGSHTRAWTVTTPSFVDTGAAGRSESVPTSAGTRWLVKNLFELKNARNVVVEQNLFENHWKDGQAGYAIVFTPRNSGERCDWCVVEDVRFEFNVVRNVAAGFNVLGYDSPEVTQQTRRVAVRHNLVYGVAKALGGNGWFMLVGDEPREIVVDHNTVDHDGTTFLYAYGGTAGSPRLIDGVVLTNNLARHGSYGVGGPFFAYGNGILQGFFPDIVFGGNYFAGASASRYPASLFKTTGFDSHFRDFTASDFRLRADSPLRGAATDGTNIGADLDLVLDGVAGVVLTDRGSAAPQPSLAAPTSPGGVRVVAGH